MIGAGILKAFVLCFEGWTWEGQLSSPAMRTTRGLRTVYLSKRSCKWTLERHSSPVAAFLIQSQVVQVRASTPLELVSARALAMACLP